MTIACYTIQVSVFVCRDNIKTQRTLHVVLHATIRVAYRLVEILESLTVMHASDMVYNAHAHKLTNTVTQRAQSATGTFYPVTLTGPDLRGGGKPGSCPEASTTKGLPQKKQQKISPKET